MINVSTRLLQLSIMAFIGVSCRHPSAAPAHVSNTNAKLEVVNDNTGIFNSPAKALQAIQEGNERYRNGQFRHIHIKRLSNNDTPETLPFVAVLTCTDLTIPAEILFDTDNKDLVVFKSAANTDDKQSMAALEQSIKNQQVKLILVLAHSACASLQKLGSTKDNLVFKSKKSLLKKTIKEGDSTNTQLTSITNLQMVVNRLRRNRLIDSLINNESMMVKGALFNDADKKLVFY